MTGTVTPLVIGRPQTRAWPPGSQLAACAVTRAAASPTWDGLFWAGSAFVHLLHLLGILMGSLATISLFCEDATGF